VHFEQVVEEDSKFDAVADAQLGNTIVENAEIAVIQVAPGLPKPAWKRSAAS
jgi:hypothetical protein